MTSKNRSANLGRRRRGAGHAPVTTTATERPTRRPMGLLVLMGLGLTGCPVGASLDSPYEDYNPTQGTPGTVTSTTSANGDCTDADVDTRALNFWCGTSTCHGTPESNETNAPLWLFSPTRTTDLLNLAAVTKECTAELIVNTTTPDESLILRSIKHTSPCGLEMPDGIDVKPDIMACIESWVNGMVASAAGVEAQPGVGGTSAF